MIGRLIAKIYILLVILTGPLGTWGGQLVPFLLFVLIPFLAIIVMEAQETQACYEEYIEEEKRSQEFLQTVFEYEVTESYIKKSIPFVESIHIKMVKCGIHSIHAGPLPCD